MARKYKFWTQSELDVLKSGVQPEGRSYRACVLICIRLKIPFPGADAFDYNRRLLKKFASGDAPGGDGPRRQ